MYLQNVRIGFSYTQSGKYVTDYLFSPTSETLPPRLINRIVIICTLSAGTICKIEWKKEKLESVPNYFINKWQCENVTTGIRGQICS